MARDHRNRSPVGAALVATALAGIAALTLAAPAAAGFETGLFDAQFRSPNPSLRAHWLDRAVDARATVVRYNVPWRLLVRNPPADPANPGDPAYSFDFLDAVMRDATARGLKPLLTIQLAPDWAERPGRPASATPGSWWPDPGQLRPFARAIATRYSGSYRGLPRVRLFQLWNEQNQAVSLAPAWDGRRPVSADHYRALLNAFYDGIKAARRDNLVVTGGTSPYGDPPGGARVRPVRFWREVFCLDRKLRKRRGCGPAARFDVFAHHPLNPFEGPFHSAAHRDDATTPDVGRLARVLRAAERRRTATGKRRHPIWATELWWETNPPDTTVGVPPERQARYLTEALHLLWRQGVKVVINLPLVDTPFEPANTYASLESGLFFADGRAKPSYEAFRFPFLARRTRKGVVAWGKAPAAGRLVVERRRGDAWRPLRSRRVRPNRAFTVALPRRTSGELRARVGPEASVPWRVGKRR